MAAMCIRPAHWDGGLAAGDSEAQGMAPSRTTSIPRLPHRRMSEYEEKDMDCMVMLLYPPITTITQGHT